MVKAIGLPDKHRQVAWKQGPQRGHKQELSRGRKERDADRSILVTRQWNYRLRMDHFSTCCE